MIEAVENVRRGLRELDLVVQLAAFSESCCDDPEDRMYRAEDQTWWKHASGAELRWVKAEPPDGWVKQ